MNLQELTDKFNANKPLTNSEYIYIFMTSRDRSLLRRISDYLKDKL